MPKELAFTVFCLENYKSYRNMNGQEVSTLFNRYGVFDYLREFYDILHSTGHNYINRDIDIYLQSRGAILSNHSSC